MKKYRVNSILISLLLVCAMAINFTGCTANENQAENLITNVKASNTEVSDDISFQNQSYTDFAVRLFKESEESDKNILISPFSVFCALAMTANGAKGETLEQMESVLGMTAEEMNQYIYSYMKNLPQEEKCKLSLANSIWLNDENNFAVNNDFLQTNADYYGADIYTSPFNEKTYGAINNWVKQNTDEMIPEILDEISADAVMYLVNALAFDAEWDENYEKERVKKEIFTKEDGTEQSAEFMHSSEGAYLKDKNAVGFMKYYSGYKYAFAAMLPDEGTSLSDYVKSLNGKTISTMLETKQDETVFASIPKFETEYSVQMSETLKKMGMIKAFDMNGADFSGLGNSDRGKIYISRVLHKTFISVGEMGTKAGAASAVELKCGSAMEDEIKEIYLNRPFVYMIIDCENNIPLFIGTVTDIVQ